MQKRAKVAVVGATGTVGREVLAALYEAEFLSDEVTVLGTERSAGEEVDYGDDTLEVEPLEGEPFRGMAGVVLAVPPDAARSLSAQAQSQGAWVVDVSPARRLDPEVPLVVPVVNGAVLTQPFRGRIVATPGPITAALAMVLEPLRARFGVKRATVTALLGASSAGQRGIKELEKQTAGLLSGREETPEVFPHRLGFNLIPQVGEPTEGGGTTEEGSWPLEAARIWSSVPDVPQLLGTAIQVPTFYGHALSMTVELGADADEAAAREVLREAPGLKVLDVPGERIYPMPMLITADPTVHVGRIRSVPGAPRELLLYAVVDNAGRGAAWNAVGALRALLSRP